MASGSRPSLGVPAQCLPGPGGQPLVGVEHEHPVAAGEIEGGVAGVGEAGPGTLGHLRSGGAGQLEGAVTAAGVDDHDLVDRPSDRGEAAGEQLLLVAGDDAERELRHASGSEQGGGQRGVGRHPSPLPSPLGGCACGAARHARRPPRASPVDRSDPSPRPSPLSGERGAMRQDYTDLHRHRVGVREPSQPWVTADPRPVPPLLRLEGALHVHLAELAERRRRRGRRS